MLPILNGNDVVAPTPVAGSDIDNLSQASEPHVHVHVHVQIYVYQSVQLHVLYKLMLCAHTDTCM